MFKRLEAKIAFLIKGARSGQYGISLRERVHARIVRWEDIGFISPRRALLLREALQKMPPDDSWFGHLAAHVYISMPLRFPLGGLVRFLWTFGFFSMAWWSRHRNPAAYENAKRTHTLLVFVIGPMPFFGGLAYLCTREAWRHDRLLPLLLLDVLVYSSSVPRVCLFFSWRSRGGV